MGRDSERDDRRRLVDLTSESDIAFRLSHSSLTFDLRPKLGIDVIGIIPGTDLGTGADHGRDLQCKDAAADKTGTEAVNGIEMIIGKMADANEMALSTRFGFGLTRSNLLIYCRRPSRHDRGDRDRRNRDRNRNRNLSPKKNKFLERAQKLGE